MIRMCHENSVTTMEHSGMILHTTCLLGLTKLERLHLDRHKVGPHAGTSSRRILIHSGMQTQQRSSKHRFLLCSALSCLVPSSLLYCLVRFLLVALNVTPAFSFRGSWRKLPNKVAPRRRPPAEGQTILHLMYSVRWCRHCSSAAGLAVVVLSCCMHQHSGSCTLHSSILLPAPHTLVQVSVSAASLRASAMVRGDERSCESPLESYASRGFMEDSVHRGRNHPSSAEQLTVVDAETAYPLRTLRGGQHCDFEGSDAEGRRAVNTVELLRAMRGGKKIRVRIGKNYWVDPRKIVRPVRACFGAAKLACYDQYSMHPITDRHVCLLSIAYIDHT